MPRTKDGRDIIEYGIIAEQDKDDGDTRRGMIGYINLPEDLGPNDLPDRIYIGDYEYNLAG